VITMYISIVEVVNNRVAKYANHETEQQALDHCAIHGGFVYQGDYSTDLYIDGDIVSIVPIGNPAPNRVTMRQARLALLGAGLLDDVNASIASLPSPQKEAAQIEWEYSQEVHRDRPFVALLTAAMGLTEQQVDDLFIAAAAL
jgi:hypothetical protein